MDGSFAPHTAPVTRLPDWVPRRMLTADDILRMVDDGVLSPDERVELIEGQLVAMASQNLPHAACIAALLPLLWQRVGAAAKLWSQSSLRLDTYNQPEPDVCVLRPRADDYRRSPHPSATDALLVIEVAESSLRYDRGAKARLYASFGVSELWVVDLAGRAVIVHRDPGPEGYGSVVTHRGDDTFLRAEALPEAALSLAEILGPPD